VIKHTNVTIELLAKATKHFIVPLHWLFNDYMEVVHSFVDGCYITYGSVQHIWFGLLRQLQFSVEVTVSDLIMKGQSDFPLVSSGEVTLSN
jgi:hypothetical protein